MTTSPRSSSGRTFLAILTSFVMLATGAIMTPAAHAAPALTDHGVTAALDGPEPVLETQRTASVSGVVSSMNDAPLSNVEVVAHRWDETWDEWGWEASVWTGEDGEYSLEGLSVGAYVFEFRTFGASTAAYTQFEGGGTELPSGPEGDAVRHLGAGVHELTTVLEDGWTVSGSVELPDGVDPGFVSVRLVRLGSDEDYVWYDDEADRVQLESDLTYSLGKLGPDGSYAVQVEGRGIAPQYYPDARTLEGAARLPGGDDLDGITLVTGPAALLSGVVTDPAGTPVPHLFVELYRWDGGWVREDSTHTDSEGSFELSSLAPGTYTFRFSPDDEGDLYRQFLGGGAQLPEVPGTENSVVLDAGENPEVTVELREGVTVSGTVHGLDGIDTDEVAVTAYSVWLDEGVVDDLDPVRSVTPDEDGAFTIPGLVPGDPYTLAVEGGGVVRTFLGGTGRSQDAEWFVAEHDMAERNLWASVGGELAGAVLDPDGEPLEDVWVSAWVWDEDEGWERLRSSVTGPGGEFSFGSVRPGVYTLHFDTEEADTTAPKQYLGGLPTAPEGPEGTGVVTIEAGASLPTGVRLEAGEEVLGTILAPEDVGWDSVEVELHQVWLWDGEIDETERIAVGEVSDGGSFRVGGLLPGGMYTLVVRSDALGTHYLGGGRSIWGSTVFTLDDVPELTFDLTGITGVRVATSLEGEPVEAYVEALRWVDDGWDEVAGGYTRSGQVVLTGIEAGTYTLLIEPDGDATYAQYLGGRVTRPSAPEDPIDAGTMFTVVDGEIRDLEVALATGVTMTGHLTAPDGVSADSLDVVVFDAEQCTRLQTISPDEDGDFTLRLAPGHSYTLGIFGYGDIMDQFLGGAVDCLDADTFAAVDGGTVSITLALGATISGTVRDEGTGEAVLGDGEVELWRWVPAREGWVWIDWAEIQGGLFNFPNVAPGTYTVVTYSDGYFWQYLGGLQDEPSPEDPGATFAVGSEDVVQDVRLVRSRSVSGTLAGAADPAALTVELVNVELEEDEHGTWIWTWRTGITTSPAPDGSFTLDGMVPGQLYTYLVHGPGVAPSYYSEHGAVLSDYDASYWPGGADVVGKNLTVVPGRDLTFEITAAVGGGPAQLGVELFRWSEADERWEEHAWTSVLGLEPATFTGLPAGRYTALLSPLGEPGAEPYARQWATPDGARPAADDPAVVVLDVTSAAQVTRPVELVEAGLVAIDIVGAGASGTTLELIDDEWYVDGDSRIGDGRLTVAARPGTHSVELFRFDPDSYVTELVRSFGDVVVLPGETTDLGSYDMSVTELSIGSVTIDGSPVIGQTLTAQVSGLSPSDATLGYQWLRNGLEIAGATSSTYTATPSDAHGHISVRVTASAEGFDDVSRTSAVVIVRPPVVEVDLVSSAPEQVLGVQGVTLTATMSVPEGIELTGSVNFRRDGVSVAVVGVVDGVAQYEVPAELGLGSHTYTATYQSGNAWIANTISNEVTIIVVAPPELPDLEPVIVGTIAVGESLEAQVSSVPGGTELTYEWLRDGVVVGRAAGYVVGLDDVGERLSVRVTASLGVAEPKSATSEETAVVPKAASNLTLSADRGEQVRGGASVQLTAVPTVPAGAAPGGDVTFTSGTQALGTVPVMDGAATLSLPGDLPVGRYGISASFEPADGRVAGSAAGPVTVTVVAAPEPEPPVVADPVVESTVELALSRVKQRYGIKKPAVLTATVTVPGRSPAGRVVFRDGTKSLGTVSVSGGVARLTVKPTLKVGNHRITAQFVPSDATVRGATSSARTLKVNKAKTKTVKVKLAEKRVTAKSRARLTVTLKVPGVAKPKGKLVIRDGKKRIATVKIKPKHGGKRTVRLPRLSPGKHRISVRYQGTKQIAAKTSKKITLRVR